jgi:hypothetical protein
MLLDSSSTARLCDELAWLRGRYDSGAVAPAVYATIKTLETELAWREHTQAIRAEECVR